MFQCPWCMSMKVRVVPMRSPHVASFSMMTSPRKVLEEVVPNNPSAMDCPHEERVCTSFMYICTCQCHNSGTLSEVWSW